MNILITGASGFLATELINQLQDTEHSIFALSSNKEKLTSKYGESVSLYDFEDWNKNLVPMESIDVVIHCAFTRTSNGVELAKSLEFTKSIFERASNFNCDIINISSRSVYGQNHNIPWTEHTDVSPDNLYALAKYSSELILESSLNNSQSNYTNIRLAGLVSPNFDDRIVNKFIDYAIKGLPINIVGGSQQFAFLDLRDAASGLIALLNKNSDEWQTSYNFGSILTHSIIEIAKMVESVGEKFDIPKVEVNITRSDASLLADMDSSSFYNDMNWKPQYFMVEIVQNIFEYKIQCENGK